VALTQQLEPLTPRWWLRRLYSQLVARRTDNEILRNYYEGHHPVPWLTSEAREEFQRILVMTKSNYLGLVVDAQVERQEVVGFRVGEEGDDANRKLEADDDMWKIWQYNGLDSWFDTGLLESAITGAAYLLVEPPGRGEDVARIHIEHPDEFVVEHTPGTNRRVTAAALKLWLDDWTGRTMATLYLPGFLWKFASSSQLGAVLPSDPTWLPRADGLGEPVAERTGLDIVPAWELPNNPLLGTGGRSEIEDLIPIQDRINKGLADRMITQDFGAFPQKWATGWPEVDQFGNPTQTIKVGQHRIVSTAAIDTKFGQFVAADLDGYIATKNADVKDIASRSRTPAQYLLGDVTNVAGDTLRMAESGLAAKVRQRNRPHSLSLENAMRWARRLSGMGELSRDVVVETLWRNPEFRSEGELVDALVKMSTIGVPQEALWERWGATPSEIKKWRAMREEELRRMQAMDPLAALAPRYGVQQGAPGAGANTPNGQRPGATKASPTRTSSAVSA
jgi:hypothetical protein